MIENERRKGVVPMMPELLAPAGNYEKLVTAVHYGADAVYLGGKNLSLRAKAGNFSVTDLAKGITYAHDHGVKVYVTVNVLAHNRDLHGIDDYLLLLKEHNADGIIIADPGILSLAKKVVPEIPLHLSTQANVTNYESARFWLNQGVVRLNLARELSLEEIGEIRQKIDGEIEVFVHGALCISYSGRCMLSNYLTDRDANSGNCSHPCRYNYALTEEKRPGQFFPVEEDQRGTYIFNSKDLCLLMLLPQLVAAGVDSLKIEGRMKSIFYVGGVVRIYRAALDYLKQLPPAAWQKPEEIHLPNLFLEEIQKTGTRGITENFMKEKPTGSDMLYESSRAEQMVEPVAVIRDTKKMILVEIRNRIEVGETIEYMGKGLALQAVTLESMETDKGQRVNFANPGNIVYMKTSPELSHPAIKGIIRRHRSD